MASMESTLLLEQHCEEGSLEVHGRANMREEHGPGMATAVHLRPRKEWDDALTKTLDSRQKFEGWW